MPAGGGIVGGQTWGVEGIHSKNIGSERSTTTFLAAGVDPDAYEAFRKAEQMARQAEVLLSNILKAIGLPALEPEEIRKLMARNPGRKNTIAHYIKKANQVAQFREKQLEERKRLAQKLGEAAEHATIDVQDTAFARVSIRIGNEETVSPDDLKGVRFRADPEGGVACTDLSGGQTEEDPSAGGDSPEA